MKYIDYNNMKEFYTIEEVCRLFEVDKRELQRYAEKYEIMPQEDQYGNWGFQKRLVRKLHNFIYKEQQNTGIQQSGYTNGRCGGPWE